MAFWHVSGSQFNDLAHRGICPGLSRGWSADVDDLGNGQLAFLRQAVGSIWQFTVAVFILADSCGNVFEGGLNRWVGRILVHCHLQNSILLLLLYRLLVRPFCGLRCFRARLCELEVVLVCVRFDCPYWRLGDVLGCSSGVEFDLETSLAWQVGDLAVFFSFSHLRCCVSTNPWV